jgi:hypothetical protein
MMNGRMFWVAMAMYASGLAACQPGYIKASELERKEQGPSHCAARCEELHMRMGALVLVGDELPGCVCQPVEQRVPAPQAANATDGAGNVADEGASAATTSYAVVLAAAAAAQRQRQLAQQQQQQQQQNAYHPVH